MATKDKLIEKLKELIDFWENIESHLSPEEWKVRKNLYDETASLEAELSEQKPMKETWECPRCGKIHSYLQTSCGCPPRTITSSTVIEQKSEDKEIIDLDNPDDLKNLPIYVEQTIKQMDKFFADNEQKTNGDYDIHVKFSLKEGKKYKLVSIEQKLEKTKEEIIESIFRQVNDEAYLKLPLITHELIQDCMDEYASLREAKYKELVEVYEELEEVQNNPIQISKGLKSITEKFHKIQDTKKKLRQKIKLIKQELGLTK